MTLLATILMLALTKAELIERMRAAPITQLSGLVQVYGDCAPDLRKEYQLPIASFVSGVCNKLYAAERMKPRKFDQPGIIVRMGDVRTNVTDVVAKSFERDDGGKFTRIRVASPVFADIGRLRIETVKAFYLAVMDREIDDDEAVRELRKADPDTRAADIAQAVADWKNGVYTEGRNDEDYLKLARGVHLPGEAMRDDVLAFASRLYLYPLALSVPFCGKYTACNFRDAIRYARIDPSVRYVAYFKASSIVLYGGGHGERMLAAAEAYSKFLFELAKLKADDAALDRMLDEADEKLKGVLE